MPAIAGDPHFVRFGSFALDLRSGELTKNDNRLLLPEQPFRILALLVRSPGALVTREHLRRELWRPDTFVDFEHSLNAAIKRLRQALGDSAATPQFIETLPRRGYRFKAVVDAGSPAASADAPINAPYALLARYYEVLCSYAAPINRHARAQVLRAVLPKVRSVCDVGCGNGETALELARRGLEVHALDCSPVFCEAVRTRARRAGLRIVVHCADMRDFRLPRSGGPGARRVRVPEQPRGPPRPAPCAGGCGSRAGRRRVVLFRRQHRAIVARRIPADVLGRRLEIQARATWKSGGRRATRSARLRVARPGRTSLAARARDAVARLLDRRGNQARPPKGRFRFRAAVRWLRRSSEDATREPRNGCLLSRTKDEGWAKIIVWTGRPDCRLTAEDFPDSRRDPDDPISSPIRRASRRD